MNRSTAKHNSIKTANHRLLYLLALFTTLYLLGGVSYASHAAKNPTTMQATKDETSATTTEDPSLNEEEVIYLPFHYKSLSKALASFTVTIVVGAIFAAIAYYTYIQYTAGNYYRLIGSVVATIINLALLVKSIKVIAFRADVISLSLIHI